MDNQIHDDEQEQAYKIVLVGDTAVGKTYLLNSYIKGMIPKSVMTTIGIEYATKTVTLENHNNTRIRAQIWDTAGQERYRAISSAHYRKAVGALVVFDLTKEKTFENVRRWIDDLKNMAEPDIVILLVGNKVDIVQTDSSARRVQQSEALSLCQEYKIQYIETSAITAFNVNDAFYKLIESIYTQRSDNGPTTNTGQKLAVGPAQPRTEEKKCCQKWDWLRAHQQLWAPWNHIKSHCRMVPTFIIKDVCKYF
eukprot:TRINITY_DN5830_c0_g1_i1.p1 TRINITY_DN5830_c0_g1~~TRINITY_DN5830_c0_g1_i1.p1  ORF type:complete len:252 (+),score=21.54 TRINITY_DN5830_c0_g1_i1:79-834(+)